MNSTSWLHPVENEPSCGQLIQGSTKAKGVALELTINSYSSGTFGEEISDFISSGEANCPKGWILNDERTRCFKLVTFDKPRTFSYGFKACNELGGTEVVTRRRNGSKETSEYPVTLASVYKLSDESAIRRTLEEQGAGRKTANGCFVGLRKYAFFKFPPGWYWIDSGNPVSVGDSEINWTSNYNASWFLRFKFPFEKCGFFDGGGLGRRPCWLIDSELSCAICGTVAYDSGGLKPSKYSELIKQADEIISKEPKLDLPAYSGLNCTDSWDSEISLGLCQNVSNILDSAWASYQNSLGLPSINFNWKEDSDLAKNTGFGEVLDVSRVKQKKTYHWDQDPDSVPALSDEMKLFGLSVQPKYYSVDANLSQVPDLGKSGIEDELELMPSKQDSEQSEDSLLSISKFKPRDFDSNDVDSVSSSTAPGEGGEYDGSGITSSELGTNGFASAFDTSRDTKLPVVNASSITIVSGGSSTNTSTLATVSTTGSTTTITVTTTTSTTTTSTTTTSTTTTSTTTTSTTTSSTSTTSKTSTSKASTSSTTSSTTTGSNDIKFQFTFKTENVRTNSFSKKSSSNPTFNTGNPPVERGVDSSMLGFGAGESASSRVGDSLNGMESQGFDTKEDVKKSEGGELDFSGNEVDKRSIIGFAVGGLLTLIGVVVCCVIFAAKKDENPEDSENSVGAKKEAQSKLGGLQLASIQPILGKKGSKIIPVNEDSSSFDPSLARVEKKSIVSVEDTTFSPEYMSSGDCGEGTKTLPYYIAQSQANTLHLHSGRGINISYDVTNQSQKPNSVKSPKYHEFYYSEASK
ncbi:C-type lectin-like domain containing protein [Cryptosporidium felis]|nr:C-type lectin-like domain containing protein [Cryptosporidium felis]